MMNRDVAKLWVKALRSGDYEQGQGALRRLTEDGPQDCCLGVLCDLAISNGIELETRKSSYDNKIVFGSSSVGVPPIEVMDWAGLEYGQAEQYADLNDVQDYTFEQIADYIEDHELKEVNN
jgi:hypothetical protein